MIITHDCDCVAGAGDESFVEAIYGLQIEKTDGIYTYGKSPRKLHLDLSECSKSVEVGIAPKVATEKAKLLAFKPDPSWPVSNTEKKVLARWLAARYNRPAFPDELVKRLEAVKENIRKAAKKYGGPTIGVFIDFEPPGEIEDMDDPYAIGISVVFDESKDGAVALSDNLRDSLRSIFEKAYRRENGVWKRIELQSCEAIPDTEFTYREVLSSYTLKLDDLSLRRTPHEPHTL